MSIWKEYRSLCCVWAYSVQVYKVSHLLFTQPCEKTSFNSNQRLSTIPNICHSKIFFEQMSDGFQIHQSEFSFPRSLILVLDSLVMWSSTSRGSHLSVCRKNFCAGYTLPIIWKSQYYSDAAYLDHFAVTVSAPAAVDIDTTRCGRDAWSKIVPCVRKQIN